MVRQQQNLKFLHNENQDNQIKITHRNQNRKFHNNGKLNNNRPCKSILIIMDLIYLLINKVECNLIQLHQIIKNTKEAINLI